MGVELDGANQKVIIDADSDTYLQASTDDTLDIYIAGAKDFTFTANTLTAQSGSTIAAQALTATTIGATGVVSISDGSAGSPALTNTGDTNCGLYFSAADTLSFTAAGTAQITMADGVVAPVTDNDVDLGTSSLEFKDGYFDGTLYCDTLNLAGTNYTTAGGAWTLLETQTASSSSLIEFDTGQITSTYDVYKIVLNNVINSADAAELYAQVSKSASYITSGYRYVVAAYTDTDTDIKAASTSASAIKITRNGTGTAAGEHCNFEITLWDPLGTDNAKNISWDGHTFNNDGVFHREIGGGGDNGSQAAIDKIKIYPGSGNIASGGFSIYGLSK